MQGHLTRTRLEGRVSSTCHCCGEPVELGVDSEAEVDPETDPEGVLLFTPNVDWDNLSAPTIVPDF